jgi:Holliday junction resolvase RusA-like endonuclease
MIVCFEIPGQAKAKARQRHSIMKCKDGRQFVHNYMPKDTAMFENKVAYEYRMQCGGTLPREGAIGISIHFFFDIPKSTTKRHREEILAKKYYPVTKKPDIDNLAKSVLDGLLGVAYKDDSQIYVLTCGKYYSENPRTVVRIAFSEEVETRPMTNEDQIQLTDEKVA